MIILLVFFACIMSVLQVGNTKAFPELAEQKKEDIYEYPGNEYQYTGEALANLIRVARMATGDFEFVQQAVFMDVKIGFLFWFYWILIALTVTIVFINFLIAKILHSYEEVSAYLSEAMVKDKAQLIAEADIMRPRCMKNAESYP